MTQPSRTPNSAASGMDFVDLTDDPHARVRYLDIATQIASYKQEGFRLLGLHAGQHVLDVGCGAGDDVRAMAEIIGPTGRVVGVDLSETMIGEARQRSQHSDAPVEFHVSDAHTLPFPDNTFDAVRSDRVVQHIPDRENVLREMLRVTRPGGHLLVSNPDWETIVVDVPDRDLYRKLTAYHTDAHTNGWAGRELYRLFRDVEVGDVSIHVHPVVITDFETADALANLSSMVDEPLREGAVSAADAEAWTRYLSESVATDRFFMSVNIYAVVGRQPTSGL